MLFAIIFSVHGTTKLEPLRELFAQRNPKGRDCVANPQNDATGKTECKAWRRESERES